MTATQQFYLCLAYTSKAFDRVNSTSLLSGRRVKMRNVYLLLVATFQLIASKHYAFWRAALMPTVCYATIFDG
jgi:hypothetical protein